MSQPKRYYFTSNNIDGKYAEAKEDVARLTAENERLRKAGDDVVRNIEVASQGLFCAIRRWDAAKEGSAK